jgi:hypothetical protein
MARNINPRAGMSEKQSEDKPMGPEIAVSVPDSFEEERREVLDSVLETLRGRNPDPEEIDACAYLMRHLSAA